MPVVADALKYRGLKRDDVAWHLLYAQNAPYIIAILDEHLGGEVPRRTVAEMTSLVEADIEQLQERIIDAGLTRSAKDYLEQWRKSGYLVRKPAGDIRQETYELSSGALAAIRFAKSLTEKQGTATRSRLSIVFEQIASLALQVSGSEDARRAALLEERAAIDARLQALDAGVVELMEDGEALERTREIIGLSREMPRDFARVSAEFERISKVLYAKLIGGSEESRDMLEDVFAGVDHVAQSPAGRSFRGFYELLRDFDQVERLHDGVDVILDAPFAAALTLEERRYLRHLLQMLTEQGRDVNETMTGLARSLRRFVQSQSFQENRLLKRLLDQSLECAASLVEEHPHSTLMPLSLELTSVPVAPLSRLALKDPGEDAPAEPAGVQGAAFEAPPMTIAELRAQVREVEIDFAELVANVNACLAELSAQPAAQGAGLRPAGKRGVSVADVLRARPATQGVASVLGLMMLGSDQGIRLDGTEVVEWETARGVRRRAAVERFAFVEEVF